MKTIELHGRTYTVKIEHDCDMGEPWKEHDGHGIVSEWTTRDKRPGELVLVSDRRSKRFYDFAGTLRLARADGWGLADDTLAQLTARLGRTPTRKEITAEAVMIDYEYLRAWCNGEWTWLYVVVTAEDGRTESLGGIDSYEYAEECARELAEQLEHDYRVANRFRDAMECGL